MRWHSASGARHEFRVMKFLCVECDRQMAFEERRLPGDGTLAAAFRCPGCGRVVALLTNPMETQLVASLGVKIGGTTLPPQPLETVRSEEHTSELQSPCNLVCRLLLEKKKKNDDMCAYGDESNHNI